MSKIGQGEEGGRWVQALSPAQVLEALEAPFVSGTAQVVALRCGHDCRAQVTEALRARDVSVVCLRPSLPWAPLVPLEQLCRHWEQEWPMWTEEDLGVGSFWLGPQVLLSRFFLRVIERLRGCKTVVWVGAEDLDAPIWGDFLRMARQQQLKLPLSFVYLWEEGQRIDAGVRQLRVAWEPLSPKAHKEATRGVFGAKLPRRVAAYLGQVLVFGDRLDLDAMKAVSRADHERRVAQLRALGMMDEEGQVCLERLREADVPMPPVSKRWRKRALSVLGREPLALLERVASTDAWLRFGHTPVLPGPQVLKARDVARRLLCLGAEVVGEALLVPEHAEDEGRFLAYLAVARTPALEVPEASSLALGEPYSWLVEARELAHHKKEGIATLNRNFQKLAGGGMREVAVLLAMELARWHLGCGRIHLAFQLLKTFKQMEDWALRWGVGILFADAYCRMGRLDLAHNHLERISSEVPKPLSPVLIGEMRLLTSRLMDASGDTETAQKQLSSARDIFRAAGDGARLGRYLVAAGELKWRAEQFEDARNLLARALDLFRRYRDGIGIQEARLKLGLVLNERPASILSG